MKKGIFLIVTMAFLISGFTLCRTGECTAEELKISHFMPTKHAQHKVLEDWAKKMESLTGGDLKVTIFPGGALGKPPHQYDNAVKGITDIAFGLQSYTPGRFPLTSVMELPFLISKGETGALVLWKLYEKYLHSEYSDSKILWVFMHGPGQVFTTKKEVRTLDDLKGLKLRSPGPVMSEVIQKLGAVPVTMPITEVYTGLERGTVDGVCGPWEIMAPFRLYEQCTYAAEADIYSMTFFVTMNKAKYESLPPDIKKVLDANIGEAMSSTAGKAYDEADAPAKKLSMDKGMKVYRLPEAEREKWKSVAMPVGDEWVEKMNAKGMPGSEVLEYAVELLGQIQ